MRRTRSGAAIAAVSALLVAAATLTPGNWPQRDFDPWCIACGDVGGVDVVANFLLFLPLGVGLGMMATRALLAVPAMVSFTLIIEVLQAAVIPGRDPALGDLLMNSAGGTAGFLLGRHLETLLRPDRAPARALLAGWALFWLAIQGVAAFSLVPAPTNSPYYGQISRELGEMFAPFPGQVLDPRIDSLPIVNWEIRGDSVRRALLRDGAVLTARALRTSCPEDERRAGIIRVADRQFREIVVLAQKGPDLVYGVRTGAEVLKLSAVRYALGGAFGDDGCGFMGDSAFVLARRSRGTVELRIGTEGSLREATLRPRGWDSWKLFSPWRRYVDGSPVSYALGAAWFLVIALPLGFFARRAGPVPASAAALAGVLVTGLAFFPMAFGVPVPGPEEWIASIAGIVAGWLTSRALESHGVRSVTERA